MTLRNTFLVLKTTFEAYNPEGLITATITAENTGELMDLAIECNKDIIKPFTDSAAQNHYYFEYPLKKNVIIKVKSLPKKLK